jgi:cell division protein FtsI (penicillin-binding protein 3)
MVQKVFNRRLLTLGILVAAAGVYLTVRLVALHFTTRITLPPKPDQHEYVRRGYIKDSSGEILALSLECRSLYANPQEIENPEDAAVKLAHNLKTDEQFFLSRLVKSKKQFVWLKRKLSEEEIARVSGLAIKGVYLKKEYARVYPHGSMAAHLLGFVNADNQGIEGIEYKYDNQLISFDDSVDTSGGNDFRNGNSLILTIDRVMQHTAEKELFSAISSTHARQGVVLITEVKSGRILAFAKYPTFDPNFYSVSTSAERSFFTVSEPYEPGSTMKIFAAGAYLIAKNGAREMFECKGSIDIGEETINCTGVHGKVDIYDSIKYSCNVGIITSMRSVNSSQWYSYMRAFGFGERTGAEVAGESPGILREIKDWSGLSKFSTSIGQEISVTSMQLAAAYGAVANDGVYFTPYLVERVVNSRGETVIQPSRNPKGRVIPEKIARELKIMLQRVVEGGTGKNAALTYYHAAGKTGTAQKSIKGSYVKDKNISSFAGFAPAGNPELCILVIIDEPQGVTAGSVVAAPVFSRIASRILPYRGVTSIAVKKYEPVQTRPTAYQFSGNTIPDFTGRTLADAVKIVAAIDEKIPIHITAEGHGRVYSQNPAPGTVIKPDDTVIIYLREKNE